MKELFEVKNNEVVYAPQVLAIGEFKDLWDRDKTKNKELANKELAFIYYSIDFRSIYTSYFGEEKIERIKRDIRLPKTWKPDAKINAAIDKYNELSRTQSMGLLEDAEYAVERLRDYFRTVDLTKTDATGKPLFTAKDLIGNLKNLGDVISGIKELKLEVLKEQQSGNMVKGNRQKSAFEDPDVVADLNY
jgi:hypothetical protein